MKNKKIINIIAVIILLCCCIGALIGLLLIKDRFTQISVDDVRVKTTVGEYSQDVKAFYNYYDGKIYFFLPSYAELENSKAMLSVRGVSTFRIDEDLCLNGMDIDLLSLCQTKGDDSFILKAGTLQAEVCVMKSKNIPALFIETESGELTYIEETKGNSEPGIYSMVNNQGSIIGEGTLKGLKSRGNATFEEDKKPYQMTLEDGANLLGEGGSSQKKYILLANRQDRSLIRDKLVYDFARDIGLDYSPASDFVDLYINNEYRGNYQLSEKIEVGKNRIDITTNKTDTATGYLVSLDYEDRYDDNEQYIVLDSGYVFEIREPENASAAVIESIKKDLNERINNILEGNLSDAALDLESFAKKYLVEELSKNLDAMYTSQFFYKDKGMKVTMFAGPVWDYDKTLCNSMIETNRPVNFQEAWGIYAGSIDPGQGGDFWYRLSQNKDFEEEVKKQYALINEKYGDMANETMDEIMDYMQASGNMDYYRWDSFENFKDQEEIDFFKSWGKETDQTRDFIEERKEFFDAIWIDEKAYSTIELDPAEGMIGAKETYAVEGYPIREPRNPVCEGKEFMYWADEEGNEIDWDAPYDGSIKKITAIYE